MHDLVSALGFHCTRRGSGAVHSNGVESSAAENCLGILSERCVPGRLHPAAVVVQVLFGSDCPELGINVERC